MGINISFQTLKGINSEWIIFSSYNKFGIPPVPVKFTLIQQLKQATFNDENVELMRPIYEEKTIIGYVYLRASLDSMTDAAADATQAGMFHNPADAIQTIRFP